VGCVGGGLDVLISLDLSGTQFLTNSVVYSDIVPSGIFTRAIIVQVAVRLWV